MSSLSGDAVIDDDSNLGGFARATERILREAAQSDSGCFVIHTPPSGCPVGWREIPDSFRTSDGRRCSACFFRDGIEAGLVVDYLRPGESLELDGLH
jgi:hypothetical protein